MRQQTYYNLANYRGRHLNVGVVMKPLSITVVSATKMQHRCNIDATQMQHRCNIDATFS
jgi:hypothetical protein